MRPLRKLLLTQLLVPLSASCEDYTCEDYASCPLLPDSGLILDRSTRVDAGERTSVATGETTEPVTSVDGGLHESTSGTTPGTREIDADASDAPSCDEDEYREGATCRPLTRCSEGEHESLANTATTDRVCAPCPEGMFSVSDNQPECAAWTECTEDEVEDSVPDATHDRTCLVKDDCVGDPCQNGGTCVDGVNAYTCECTSAFGGLNCDNPLSWCEQRVPPSGVVEADYGCADFDEGMPSSWESSSAAGSARSQARASSPSWSWLSNVAEGGDQGVVTWASPSASAISSASANVQVNPDGLPGPVGGYSVDLVCIEFSAAWTCLRSDGLNSIHVFYEYSGAGWRAGTCTLNQGLALDTWQEIRLTLAADGGAVEVHRNGSLISEGCEIGSNLNANAVSFQVGASEPSADFGFSAHFDDVEVWVER